MAENEHMQISFDNVAHDVKKLDAFSRESRSLMEQWNTYFVNTIKKLELDNKQLKKSNANVDVDKFHSELERFEGMHTKLHSILDSQQKSIDLLKKDVKEVETGLSSFVTSYNKYLSNILDEFSELKQRVGDVEKRPTQSASSKTVNVTNTSDTKILSINQPTPIEKKVKQAPKKFRLNSYVKELSAAEQAILYIFVSKNRSMSYEEVAAHYGRAKSTVTNIISRLKKRSIPLIVRKGKNGIKLHQLETTFRKKLLAKSDIVKKTQRKAKK